MHTGEVYCWGLNGVGQLGDGSQRLRTRPVRVKCVDDAVQLAAGRYFTCALRGNGSIRCWGDRGQLGTGDSRPKAGGVPPDPGPGYVQGIQDAVQLTAGLFHACALRLNGRVSCWGSNRNQQLGDGSGPDAGSGDDDLMAFSPVDVLGLSDGVLVAAGNAHTCAIRRGGDVVCWGFNEFGQLGDGTHSSQKTPVAVQHLHGVVALSAGGFHTCALTREGKAFCWGRNDAGQLGNGTDRDTAVALEVPALSRGAALSKGIAGPEPPVSTRAPSPPGAAPSAMEAAPRSAVVQLVAGERHTCARHLSGAVQCWGSGEGGRLGHGTEADHRVPTPVASIGDAIDVSAGGMHTCALRATAEVLCWGVNDGQIGDGTTRARSVPTPVRGLPTPQSTSASGNTPD